MKHGAAITAALAMASLALVGCDAQPVDNVGTHSAVAPPLGVTPTPDADPTRAQATSMASPINLSSRKFEHYVSLGDSYAAMGSASGENADSEFCANSADNYPNELAQLLGRKTEFTAATCQGSTTEHISGAREVEEKNVSIPPQIRQLDKDVDLITVSLGGNDMDFAGIARCVNDTLGGASRNCIEEYALSSVQQLAELPDKLTKVHATIRKASPDAVVVATGYMPLVSLEQECELTDRIGREGVEWAMWLTAAINNIVKLSAEAQGAIFVLPEDVEQHTTCASVKDRWVDIDGTDTNSYPAHPTPNGQKQMAKTVAQALKI